MPEPVNFDGREGQVEQGDEGGEYAGHGQARQRDRVPEPVAPPVDQGHVV